MLAFEIALPVKHLENKKQFFQLTWHKLNKLKVFKSSKNKDW